jgi:S1-C subfamily serine protease
VIRADLGISRVFITNQGLLVVGLVDGGPASRAGIHAAARLRISRFGRSMVRVDPGAADVIVAIDGTRVQNVDEMLTEVEAHAPGDVVKVTVLRSGKLVEVPVRLGQSS